MGIVAPSRLGFRVTLPAVILSAFGPSRHGLSPLNISMVVTPSF
jgi:hypothetical protein